MTRSAAAVPLALALVAACGDHAAVREAEARPVAAAPAAPTASPQQQCDPGNGGITLPAGFCATVFADVSDGGRPRHIAIAPNGDVYVGLEGRNGGGVLALRDTNRDGKADQQERFGTRPGTGIAIADGWLYHGTAEAILRWRLAPGRLAPAGEPQTIVGGLPIGGHSAKTIAVGRGGLFVNIGSRSNACQQADRQAGSRGHDPCTELETRAGIWRFDAARPNQAQSDGERFATGIRNAVAITLAPNGQLWAAQHGRDQLHDSWPDLYDQRKSAENPAEELLAVNRGDDFGWPYCFYDVDLHRLVLAPEYGGRGGEVGRCAQKKAPVAAFPGHWAPEAVAFYTGTQFPARYRGGVFVSFHGSWNRAPLPQEGFRVAFVPARGGRPGSAYETFADGFRGAAPAQSAAHRPMGLAVAPDGALFITDDAGGRIWRVVWRGR
jgi:glucose/arabinose dehydrogenase